MPREPVIGRCSGEQSCTWLSTYQTRYCSSGVYIPDLILGNHSSISILLGGVDIAIRTRGVPRFFGISADALLYILPPKLLLPSTEVVSVSTVGLGASHAFCRDEQPCRDSCGKYIIMEVSDLILPQLAR